MMTLEDYLEQDAIRYPDKTAVICGDEQCTYAELWQRVIERVAELGKASDFSHQTSDITQIVCLTNYRLSGQLLRTSPGRLCRSPIGARYAGNHL